VSFGELDDATLEAYLAGGEWQGKAGAYGIQGSAQAFIAHLSGSHSGVMGLPLYETARLLRAAGLLAPDHAIGAAA
jgi:septum formation protein